jgi:asparagine synthase (glutamine-hydrolysing)
MLGCLRKSSDSKAITCVNYFSSAAYDDERFYARLAAQRSRVTLLEFPMETASARFDSRLLKGPTTSKPAISDLFRSLEIESINGIAAATGARAVWTGQGGDHIFWQTTDPSSAADYLATRGLRPGFISAVRDAAQLSRQPYWHVLRSARTAAAHRAGSRVQTPAQKPWLINPSSLPENLDIYLLHPWASDAEDLPPGKRSQIDLLGQAVNRHRPIPHLEQAPQHHPLLSQPLMEVCLQIPTYLLIRGGRERALAREAFADRVPQEIIQRCDKGSISSHAIRMIRQREPFVRELLLEGELAGAELIAPNELEPHLIGRQPFREDHLLPLLACVAAEIWLRRCRQSAVAVAV